MRTRFRTIVCLALVAPVIAAMLLSTEAAYPSTGTSPVPTPWWLTREVPPAENYDLYLPLVEGCEEMCLGRDCKCVATR